MTKICKANLIDESGAHLGDLEGIVFTMGTFMAHDAQGRFFFGQINPATNEIIKIYEWRNP